MPAPHALPITVSAADRLTRQGGARRPKTAHALALRARIVLATVEGEASNGEIAERRGTHRHTVAKWRRRHATRGLAGLTDEPRPGAPRTVTDGREKTQVPAREPTAPVVPTRPGQPERRTHDHIRHGTTDLVARLDVASGQVIAATHRRHRSAEFRRFSDTSDAAVPPDLDVHLVLDNAATHTTAVSRGWLARRPRVRVHFTPNSASWLNLVETWFPILQRRELAWGG
jgi:transposase-like protein/transposase